MEDNHIEQLIKIYPISMGIFDDFFYLDRSTGFRLDGSLEEASSNSFVLAEVIWLAILLERSKSSDWDAFMDLFSKETGREDWRYSFVKSKGIGVPRNPNFGLLFDTKKALGFAGLELTSFRRTYNASMSFIELPYFSEDAAHPESMYVMNI